MREVAKLAKKLNSIAEYYADENPVYFQMAKDYSLSLTRPTVRKECKMFIREVIAERIDKVIKGVVNSIPGQARAWDIDDLKKLYTDLIEYTQVYIESLQIYDVGDGGELAKALVHYGFYKKFGYKGYVLIREIM